MELRLTSSKVRTTWKMASVAEMCERKAFPRPSPLEAPCKERSSTYNTRIEVQQLWTYALQLTAGQVSIQLYASAAFNDVSRLMTSRHHKPQLRSISSKHRTAQRVTPSQGPQCRGLSKRREPRS